GVDVHGVGALGDGVIEGLSAEDFVAGEAVVAAGVPGFAHAEGVGPGDEGEGCVAGVGADDVEVGAVVGAAVEQGGGVGVGVGGVDAVEARAEEVAQGGGAGHGEVPGAAVGGGVVVRGEAGLQVGPVGRRGQGVEAGGDGLEVDGLEAVGFFGGEAGVTQEIAVAGGVDEEGRS